MGTPTKMLAVIMDGDMKNDQQWGGALGINIAGRIYVDMAGDLNDSQYLAPKMKELEKNIRCILGGEQEMDIEKHKDKEIERQKERETEKQRGKKEEEEEEQRRKQEDKTRKKEGGAQQRKEVKEQKRENRNKRKMNSEG